MTSVYEEGALVLSESSFAHALNSDNACKVCDVCLLSPVNVKMCGSCRVVRYCSRVCQIDAWKQHRHECHILSKLVAKKKLRLATLLVLRIFLKLEKGDKGETTMPDGSLRSFYSLESHTKYIREDNSLFLGILEDFEEIMELEEKERRLLFDIFCKVHINAFDLTSDNRQLIGAAIYIRASIFDHACRPNAERSFRGDRIFIRAIKNISDFGQVRLSYVNVLKSRRDRRSQLLKQSFFLCECDLCSRPSSRDRRIDELKSGGIRCPRCTRDVAINKDVFCPKCNYVFDDHFRNDVKLFKMRMRGQNLDSKVLKEAMNKLSLYDFDMLTFVRGHVQNLVKLDQGLQLALRTLNVLREMLFRNDIILAEFLRDLALAEIECGQYRRLKMHLEEALRIYIVVCGRDHKCTRQILNLIVTSELRGFFF